MSRMDVTAAVMPAYRHMVHMLFSPFNLKKWLALGFVSLLASGAGGGGGSFPRNTDELNSAQVEQALQWMSAHWGLVVAAVLAVILLSLLITWLGSIFRMVYTDQVVRDSGAVKEPFSRLKKLGTSLFLWQLGFGTLFIVACALLIGLPLGIVFASSSAEWAKGVAFALGLALFFTLFIFYLIVSITTLELASGVMYTRGVKVLEAWRLLLPRIRENAGQWALYILLLFAFGIGAWILAIFAVFIVLLALAIPFGGIFAIAVLIGRSAGLVWNPVTISIAIFYGTIFFSVWIYVLSCVLQPLAVFFRSFSLAVLGQMDESFATVPTGIEALPQDEQ